jgi:PKD repeat protein
MNPLQNRFLFILILALTACICSPLVAAASEPIIIDHTSTHLDQVPLDAIQNAKSVLHIAYGHTSHGSQITDGMTGLVSFPNTPLANTTYRWNNGGSGGALDLRDSPFSGASDLGNPSYTAWSDATRTYLNAHPTVNVIIWSWCGQADTSAENIDLYLSRMNQLETDYPNVKFVYMTGHLVGTGEDGNLNQRNEQIRAYVRAHNKILFDFADIESYDPDGLVNYMVLNADDGCNYNGGNWATAWQNSHTPGVDWYNCGAAHTEPLNANMKAYAAWYLWARLAGWDGSQIPGPDSDFSATPRSGVTPLSVQFTDLSTGNSISSWEWDFTNDGSVDSTGQNPQHVYTTAGTYTVKLAITDADGSDDVVKTDYITVQSPAPVAEFSATPRSGVAPLSVQFTDLSTGTGIGGWEWDFDNNGVVDSTEQNPQYSYAADGSYTVRLRVTSSFGNDETVKTDYITVQSPAPVAEFSATPRSGVAPLSVQFTDLSTGTGIGGWEWDFDNNGVVDSTEQNPQYSYTAAGTYTVKLNVSGTYGNDSAIKTNYITVSAEPPAHTVPVVTARVSGDTVVMNWQQIDDADFLGYKVVVSKNPDPAYPEDGYMFWITSRTTTSATLDNRTGYNGGDIGGYLVPGETYYFSVTAMYQPYTPVAGNAVRLIFPGSGTPTLVALPGQSGLPTDPDSDGLYEDLNANSRADFADVTLFFDQMEWIAGNEPVGLFDFNGNGRADFTDIVKLFEEL